MLDDYAADFLKPKTADTKFFEESEKLKDELARKNIELDFLESDNRRLTSENEKMKNSLDGEILKSENLQKCLDEQISKNDDLIKSVNRLTEDISEKSKLIDELRSANSELSEQLADKSKKWYKR